MAMEILVATHNQGKVKELKEYVNDLNVVGLSLDDVKISIEIEESGGTFEENAIKKATYYALDSGMLTIADDSGLEVDALDGKPGVHTARFGGVGLTPKQRYELLLRRIEGVEWTRRTARFYSVVALANRKGLIGTAIGICEGIISKEPVGTGGFGYDPVFFIPELNRTMAQLSPEEKRGISHRGKAMTAISPLLRQVISNMS